MSFPDIGPQEFAPEARLGLENFTWNFLKASPNTWAVVHILNPFFIQLLFQDWKKTVIAFLSWEVVEVSFMTLFKNYSVFVGDDSGVEPVTDSMIGDPLNGLLGLILAYTFGVAFKMPYWNMSYFGPARTTFWRQLVAYLFITISFSIYNAHYQSSTMEVPFRFGVFITATIHFLVILSLMLVRCESETKYVWESDGDPDSKRERHRSKTYIGIAAIAMLFHALGGTYFITFVYYQAWSTWALCMVSLVLFTAAQGRVEEFYYYFVTWNISTKPLY